MGDHHASFRNSADQHSNLWDLDDTWHTDGNGVPYNFATADSQRPSSAHGRALDTGGVSFPPQPLSQVHQEASSRFNMNTLTSAQVIQSQQQWQMPLLEQLTALQQQERNTWQDTSFDFKRNSASSTQSESYLLAPQGTNQTISRRPSATSSHIPGNAVTSGIPQLNQQPIVTLAYPPTSPVLTTSGSGGPITSGPTSTTHTRLPSGPSTERDRLGLPPLALKTSNPQSSGRNSPMFHPSDLHNPDLNLYAGRASPSHNAMFTLADDLINPAINRSLNLHAQRQQSRQQSAPLAPLAAVRTGMRSSSSERQARQQSAELTHSGSPSKGAAAAAEARLSRQMKRRRQSNTSGANEASLSVRVLERKVKNRESAAKSRMKRLVYTEDLEAQVTALHRENRALRQAMAEHSVPVPPAANAAAAAAAAAITYGCSETSRSSLSGSEGAGWGKRKSEPTGSVQRVSLRQGSPELQSGLTDPGCGPSPTRECKMR